MNILAIEDDIDFGDMLELQLTAWGHKVTLTRNWLSMMMTINTQPFDAIIADIETPTGNGLTALSFLSEDEKVREIPKIFVTGLNDAETRNRCEAINAAYVHKSSTVMVDLKTVLGNLGRTHQTATS
ncbi:MAG: response regulator [Rubripirellula sp.]